MGRSPYFKTDADLKKLIEMRDATTFNETPPDNRLVLIAGAPGAGKTHLACTMTELGPVYLLDTEFRAHLVTKKFDPILIKRRVIRNYREAVATLKYIIKNFPPPGTIVWDSGTDLQQFAEMEYCERADKDRVGLPRNWADVWQLIDAIVEDCKFSGYSTVFTSRVKEEYISDKPTGKIIPRIYSNLPYKMDLAIQLNGDGKCTIIKNGFSLNSFEIRRDLSLPEIIRRAENS